MAVDVRDPSEERARAIAFLIDAYAGVRTKPGKGLPHAQAVADVLRDAGYDSEVRLAALLHDVVEDTDRVIEDVEREFGDTIGELVAALTEDDSIPGNGARKQALRDQLRAAGSPALDIALADKIATMRHAALTGMRIPPRKLDHYRATLRLGREAHLAAPLRVELEDLLSGAPGRQASSRAQARRGASGGHA
jgi:(p)ppGpp synthase/HD superfamily hydrolase